MGYRADGRLADLFPDVVSEAAPEIVKRVGERLHSEVRRRTPIAQVPLAYGTIGGGGRLRWIKDRKGRLPGTLVESWETSDVTENADGTYSVVEESKDPVAILVEDDTRPHAIRPRKHGGVLRFPYGERFVFRSEVHHPGTQGVHMMRDSLVVIDTIWMEIAGEVLDEVAARDAARAAPSALVSLRGAL